MGRKRKKNIHLKKVIGVYCEGKSEEQYFKMLSQKYNAGNVHSQHIKIDSLGESGEKLIKEAIKKGKYNKQSEIFVVFDRDEKSDIDLKNCQQLAKKNKVTILFSSICFEIWILMHFEKVMRSYTRRQLFSKLSKKEYFNQDYNTFKGSSYRQYIYDNVNIAHSNSEKLYLKHHCMVTDDPYTDIHLGIEKIFQRKVF